MAIGSSVIWAEEILAKRAKQRQKWRDHFLNLGMKPTEEYISSRAAFWWSFGSYLGLCTKLLGAKEALKRL